MMAHASLISGVPDIIVVAAVFLVCGFSSLVCDYVRIVRFVEFGFIENQKLLHLI